MAIKFHLVLPHASPTAIRIRERPLKKRGGRFKLPLFKISGMLCVLKATSASDKELPGIYFTGLLPFKKLAQSEVIE